MAWPGEREGMGLVGRTRKGWVATNIRSAGLCREKAAKLAMEQETPWVPPDAPLEEPGPLPPAEPPPPAAQPMEPKDPIDEFLDTIDWT
jgi:hypothetical protein